MKKYRYFICFLLLISSFSASSSPHKFYMSIASISYNAQTESLEIIIKFFTDDLEKALEASSDSKLFLATEKESSETDSLINVYLENHLSFSQKNKRLTTAFLGKEANRDYTFAYIEIEDFNTSRNTQLKNTLLISTFKDQVNQVNYKNGDRSKSISMHKDFTQSEF